MRNKKFGYSIAFFALSTLLFTLNIARWVFLFLSFFYFTATYKTLTEKINRAVAERVYFVATIALLVGLLFITQNSYLFARMTGGDFFYYAAFCSFAVLGITVLRRKFFPEIKQQTISMNAAKSIIGLNILAAASEELWFRGAIFLLISKDLGLAAALIISSLFFSLVHIGKNRLIIIWSFVNGLIFASFMAVSQNIFVPIFGHFLLNILNKYKWSLNKNLCNKSLL